MPNCKHCGHYFAVYTDDCPFLTPEEAKPCSRAIEKSKEILSHTEDLRKTGHAHLVKGTPEHYLAMEKNDG